MVGVAIKQKYNLYKSSEYVPFLKIVYWQDLTYENMLSTVLNSTHLVQF